MTKQTAYGADLSLRFPHWESALGRAAVATSSVGAWQGITSPGVGSENLGGI